MKAFSFQRGLTITELMVAMTIGLLITLLASGLLLASQTAYLAQDQHAQVQETGRYAMEMLSRAIRQAGYTQPDAAHDSADTATRLFGMDATSLRRTTVGLDGATSSTAVHGSDVLALSYSGDDVMFNCAGMTAVSSDEDGWSIFFVSRDRTGEPELRCKYKSRRGWNAEAIARGIESFQVLYGVDVDGNGVVDRYINASGIEAMDDAMNLNGENAPARLADRTRRTHWKKVRSVKVAILVRSAQAARDGVAQKTYDLFDDAYLYAADIGVRISEADMSLAERKRIRKVFIQTIQLRNAVAANDI